MPNKKKNNSRYTGFYWYMQEIMPDLKREGRVRGGIDQVVPVARPMWKAMTKQEQDKYEKIAKEMKRKDSNNLFGLPKPRDDSERLDNVGNVIAHRENKDEVHMEQRSRDRRFARSKWPDEDEMLDFPFYFIGFEYLCETDEEKEFIPIEVALLKWTMRDGINEYYHKFVDPGQIPVGYRYTCQNHSDETHQIPISNFELADRNYLEIWCALEDMVNPRGQSRDFPPVYSAVEDYRANISMLTWLYAHARPGRRNTLEKVFVLEDCCQDLAELKGVSISQGSATSMLNSSMFDYEPDTTCPWHEEKEVKNCALGTVKKYAYAMADFYCSKELYNFDLKPKSHLPTRESTQVNHTTIHPDRVYMEPQGVSGVSRQNPPSVKGAMPSTESNVPFASRDIRYTKPHEPVKINLDEDSDDDDIESQYSYSTKLAASSYSDRDRPKSAWASYVPQTVKPDIKDVEEFPTLGGDSRFASRASAPPAHKLPKPAFSDSNSDGLWQPSSAYLEQRQMKEERLASLPSLQEKVMAMELNNNSQPKIDPWDSKPEPGRPRQINASSNSWSPNSTNSSNAGPVGRGRGAAAPSAAPTAAPVGRGRGMMNFGGNPWAKGATRGNADKGPPPGMGVGRGRGSWVPSRDTEPGVPRPSSPSESVTSQVSSSASTASSVRPPPGFGRGFRPQVN